MKSNIRDTFIGFASIVFSICAGIWTFYNYNVNQKARELETIFSITEKIELVKLKALEIKILDRHEKSSEQIKKEKKEEEMLALIYTLLSEIRYRYTQIKKPLSADKKNWDATWKKLFDYTNNALSSAITTGVLSDNFNKFMRGINEPWDKILKTKNMQSLEKAQNSQS